MDDFVRDYDTFAWYLNPAAGSGVLPGTIPVHPVCLRNDAWATHVHFDLSLSDYVVDDAPRGEMVRELRGKQHCSLISASGAGKTKAALDLLKVRTWFALCAGAIWSTILLLLDCFALVVFVNTVFSPPPPPLPPSRAVLVLPRASFVCTSMLQPMQMRTSGGSLRQPLRVTSPGYICSWRPQALPRTCVGWNLLSC
jgi:hypothetical protein